MIGHLTRQTRQGFVWSCALFLLLACMEPSTWGQTPLKGPRDRIRLPLEVIIKRPERRGLLANPILAGQAVKGVYFFPGEGGGNGLYTTHPTLPDDLHWNSDEASRGRVMDRIAQAHVNTVVMSYWSNMPQWSPMVLDGNSLPGVISAVQGKPLVIMPAIEGGYDANHPEIPHWEFSKEFPQSSAGLVDRIGNLVTLFSGHMDKWARMYDRTGAPRYAVNIIHVASDVLPRLPGQTDDLIFARAFDKAADDIFQRYKIRVGFTLDTIGNQRYSASPAEAGPIFERTDSILAIQGFASEVFSGKVKNARPNGVAHDNNADNNISGMADWKRAAVRDWVKTGVPVILDVLNGFDGRKVWASSGAGFWGDNAGATDDRWRNWMSELKGPGIKGIVFDTWNGYTEGYAAVPSAEHGETVYNWLHDLMEPPPWDYSHMHYVNGRATNRVYGAIAEKWIQLGADRGFGPPTSPELPARNGRVQYFAVEKAIYWSGATGAHEMHGLIFDTYKKLGSFNSRLGLPTTDEQNLGTGKVNRFEHGRIEWYPGDKTGRVFYS